MRETRDKDIGAKILKIMRDKGVKQIHVAEACEVAPSFLNRVLHGSKRIPDDLLEKITAALQIDFDELDDCCSCNKDTLTRALHESIALLDDVQKCELLKQAKMMVNFKR